MEKDDFLLKSISYSWIDYFVIDQFFESSEEKYWINKIYKNSRLISKKMEKNTLDKKSEDLKKELFDFFKVEKNEYKNKNY